jgi:D-sedoheptulose 7-phosphate isomerase
MIDNRIREIVKESITAHARLLYDDRLVEAIGRAAEAVTSTLKKGGKVLIFGNGGSAADSQHFAAELVGRFQKERRALAAVALSTDTSLLTAVSNDYSFEKVFQRQIEALGRRGDLAFALSTSGDSPNVLAAVSSAKKMKIRTVGLTGEKGGRLAKAADICVRVPAGTTARVQEIHILIIHAICALIEEALST